MSDVANEIQQRWGARARQRLGLYHQLLMEWNERLNLTAIVDETGVWVKHFWDSLLIADSAEWQRASGARVADVGTGAGFPGLVLAICFPDREFLLCDALNKRIEFLKHVVERLQLSNVELVHGRAEVLGQQGAYRQQFDFVVSRAVARLNVLLELTAPFAKIGGLICAYKGPSVVDEIADGTRAAGKLGSQLVRVDERSLPDDMGQRSLVWWRQDSAVPKRYPRRAGTPQKQPL